MFEPSIVQNEKTNSELFEETTLDLQVVLPPSAHHPQKLVSSLLDKLAEKEKRCHCFGFLEKILGIEDYSDGIFRVETFDGSTLHNVRAKALVCNPVIGQRVWATVRKKDKLLVSLESGPLMIICQLDEDMNSTINELQVEEEIEIKILGIRFDEGDTFIKIIGSIIN